MTGREIVTAPGSYPKPHRVLSVVIPAYNEERFIGTLIEKVRAVDLSRLGFSREIIVVDDHSNDGTAAVASAFDAVIVRRQERNGGKGAAVRAGIALATGDFIIIQDADLEYEPNDYVPMLEALLAGRGDVVYGSRYMRAGSRGVGRLFRKHANQSWMAYLGGRSLSLVALACTGHYLSDTVTALKLFPRQTLKSLTLETSGFELDHEISAKVLARGSRIVEVPISYFPRSKSEGKKIGMRDWFVATGTFFRYRKG